MVLSAHMPPIFCFKFFVLAVVFVCVFFGIYVLWALPKIISFTYLFIFMIIGSVL